MSVYEGTIGEREYAHGRDEGRAAADALAEAQASAWPAYGEADAREWAERAVSPRSRAFYIGWLRGFREVSR